MAMDFDVHYTDEQQNFRTVVHAWLEEHVPQAIRGLGHEHEESDEQYAMRRKLGRELGALGWLYPMGPKEYGGGGLDIDSAMVLIDEMHEMGLFLPPYYDSGGSLGSVAILVWGSDEQKKRLLPPIYSGEQRTWQLLTEPGAGSDVAAASTTAVRDGDDYLITGQKIFVGSAHGCEAMWTLVRTGPAENRHANLSWFMIPFDLPGITTTPLELMGSSDKNMVFLDTVRVPAFNLVGGENRGWEVATTHLDLEHGLRTDHLIGRRLAMLFGSLVDVCEDHEIDGVPITQDDAIQDLLAEAYVKTEVVRLLGIRNFWLAMADQPRSYEGSQAYYLEKKTSQWFAQQVLDVLGPYALLDDGSKHAASIAGIHSGAISGMHGGGTAEIQKLVMARRMGVGRRQAEASGRLA
jgi:alkylation response protein AidB-like acyl-CoA dehydrogenase